MRGIKVISSLIGAAGFIAVAAGFTVPTGNGSEAPKQQGAPYLLDVCPISGRPLPEDGGVVVILEGASDSAQAGREVRVCCDGCKGKIEKDPAKFIGKIDELIIADQLARYPKSMGCPVMDSKALPDPTGPEAKECTLIVYKNRLVRFCCAKCTKAFYKDPEKYIAKLDAAAIAEQKTTYPLTTCLFTGGGLKESSPWFIVGDRAVNVCCGGCKPKAMKDPRGAIAKLDAATAKTATPTKTSG